jgi:hypothetical protein
MAMEWIMRQYFTDTANYEFVPFLPWQAVNQIATGFIPEEIQSKSQNSESKLRAEIATLKRELAAVKQEKAKLEILVETISGHSNAQVYPLQIEIDQNKRSRQVAEITQADYFQQLLAEVELLRT